MFSQIARWMILSVWALDVDYITTSAHCLFTPRCRALLEKLTGLQLVKKFPVFHRTRRFITALTSVRHLSLSWASPIQSIYPHPTSWRLILILSTHLCLGLLSGSFPPISPPRPYTPPSPPIAGLYSAVALQFTSSFFKIYFNIIFLSTLKYFRHFLFLKGWHQNCMAFFLVSVCNGE